MRCCVVLCPERCCVREGNIITKCSKALKKRNQKQQQQQQQTPKQTNKQIKTKKPKPTKHITVTFSALNMLLAK